MRKPVLCLNFDGVVHSYTSGWQGARNIPDPPVKGAVEFMSHALASGWDVVIYSSRALRFGGLSAMRRWLKKHAVGFWDDDRTGPGVQHVRFARWKPRALITMDNRPSTGGTWPVLADLNALRARNKQ